MMYLWPFVVFYPHLRGRSRSYCFAFCTAASVMLVNTFVLGLGLAHILRTPVAVTLYYGIFLWRLLRLWWPHRGQWGIARRLRAGTLSPQRLALRAGILLGGRLRAAWRKFCARMKGRWLEYGALLVLLAFGTLYFSWNALQMHAYGCGDQYVHRAWIYGLEKGTIFSAGIYPEAMHCCIYLACALFHIPAFSGVLFFAGLHVHTFLLAAYLFMKSVFRWRYTPLFVLTLYLTVNQLGANQVFGMSRLSWTLPMEFGFFAMYLCAWSLLRFLKEQPKIPELKRLWKQPGHWGRYLADENLLIFFLSVSVTIASHFYCTIFAIFICLAVAGVYVRKVFTGGRFSALAIAAVAALLLAVIPMALSLAQGNKLQGSLYWAINVIEGKESAAASTAEPEETETPEETPETVAAAPAPSLRERVLDFFDNFQQQCYRKLYGRVRGPLLLSTTLGLLSLSLVGCAVGLLKKRRLPLRFDGYLLVPLLSLVLMTVYRPSVFHLPQLIESPRVYSNLQLTAVMVYGCLLDLLCLLANRLLKGRWMGVLSVLLCVGIYVGTQLSGIFHSYLHYEITRYPVAVHVSAQIVNRMEKEMYTVVSTTEELYQVISTGYHEEWIDLIEGQRDPSYTIPTPYVFCFVEKRPIHYAQHNFSSGPAWLAWENYVPYYGSTASLFPAILHGEISEASALEPLSYGKKRSDTAAVLSNRIILESKAYAWVREFARLHPNAGEVVYEDEDFFCYCFRQNEFDLYSLSILPEEYYGNIVDTTKTAEEEATEEETAGEETAAEAPA